MAKGSGGSRGVRGARPPPHSGKKKKGKKKEKKKKEKEKKEKKRREKKE